MAENAEEVPQVTDAGAYIPPPYTAVEVVPPTTAVEVKGKKPLKARAKDFFTQSNPGEAPLYKCMLSELIGTFFLVFMGCGACMKNEDLKPPDSEIDEALRNISGAQWYESRAALSLQISLSFATAVAVIVYALGHISSHINPAVTLGLIVTGTCPLCKGLIYIPFQLLGSTLGTALLVLMDESRGIFGEPQPDDPPDGPGPEPICYSVVPIEPFTIIGAVVTEYMITCLLVLVVCSATDPYKMKGKESAPLMIGLAVFLGHIMGMRYSGSSMNPARSFGPLIIGSMVDLHMERMVIVWKVSWIYWLGPCTGGVSAGLLYKILLKAKPYWEETPESADKT